MNQEMDTKEMGLLGQILLHNIGQRFYYIHMAGESYQKVKEFLDSGEQGTSKESIYDCINWCIAQGRDVVGGRNFSTVHDPWNDGGKRLIDQLREDSDKFKLRRSGNEEN